jgi:hypothetical protein
MNGEEFQEWFGEILSKLYLSSVTVMDNAPYHDIYIRRPTK